MKSPWMLPLSVPLAIGIVLFHAASPVDGAVCPTIDIEVPNAMTLMASKTNPAKEAWVVTPKCDVKVVGITKSLNDMIVDFPNENPITGIERIASVPTDTTMLSLFKQPKLKSIDVSKSSKLKGIVMLLVGGSRLDLFLPKTLQSVAILMGSLETLDNIDFPVGMITLRVEGGGIRSLQNVKLPPALRDLTISKNKLTSIDFNIPSGVDAFDVSGNTLSKLDGLVLPDVMTAFDCDGCGLTSVQGVRWPAIIEHVRLNNNPISSFEIRQRDVRTFETLDTFWAKGVTQTSCKEPNAELKTIQGVPVCVIDDDLFESLYPPNEFPDPTSPPAPTTSSSGSAPSGSSSSDEDELDEDTTPPPRADSNSSSEIVSTESTGQPEVVDNSNDSTLKEPASSVNSTLLIALGLVGSLFAVLIAVISYRVFFVKKRRGDDDKYDHANTPMDDTMGSTTTQEYLTNDVRNDKNLLPYRIERGEVQLGKVIARGGFGMVYRGKYDGRDVAIKQMLPDAWRNDTMLASFMDEIRLCASLDHPKIVQFVGITWSSLRDLSVLTEFMAGGDLYDLLYQPANGPRAEHWSQPWSTMTVSNLKCKTQVALDVAEAVVYLHSFESPIIHRDLKSKNVLLDGRGNAKLSDFGISREMVVDETMTSEIGTSAWIAPEVLRGERYSEKADIYSLGVVLVELDRCCHPYEGEPMLAAPQTSVRDGRKGAAGVQSFASKSAQIAVLVSTGRLRPSMSRDAPRAVKDLVGRCLVNNPEDRVNAMEVFYELRQILRGMQQHVGAVGFF